MEKELQMGEGRERGRKIKMQTVDVCSSGDGELGGEK